MENRHFDFKKVQIENYLKAEFQRKFRSKARISMRKRQKFVAEVTKKVSRKFGKEVLCLVDFSKGGFTTLVSPARTESTDKGKLIHSFAHPQVFYTSHCIERFSSRTETEDNCVLRLDAYMEVGLLSFGEHEGYLTCQAGVFAYEMEGDRLVVKTYINAELLTGEQIKKFYGPGMISKLPEFYLAEEVDDSDFMLMDEHKDLPEKPQK